MHPADCILQVIVQESAQSLLGRLARCAKLIAVSDEDRIAFSQKARSRPLRSFRQLWMSAPESVQSHGQARPCLTGDLCAVEKGEPADDAFDRVTRLHEASNSDVRSGATASDECSLRPM